MTLLNKFIIFAILIISEKERRKGNFRGFKCKFSMKKTLIALLLVFQLPCAVLHAEKQKKMSAKDYIETYKSLAVEAMQEYGIPASIKLAQALIESDNGNSPLALKANNHFGIKCKTTWSGDKMLHDDDEKDECFRSYQSAYDSYRDHSDFLADSPRYRFLFDLDPNDYKGWARGLSHAGYATNPDYANMLIKAIEQNGLYKIDREITANTPSLGKSNSGKSISTDRTTSVTAPVTASVRNTVPADTVSAQTSAPQEKLPDGVIKIESRPGTVQKTVSTGPIIIPGPKVIGSTRAPQRPGRATQAKSTVVVPPRQSKSSGMVPPLIASTDNAYSDDASKSALDIDDIYAYNPDDFEPAKPAEEFSVPAEETYQRKHIDMPPAPEAARPSGTSDMAYGAPVNSPAGYYDGPKFDPAGMPASGSKGGILIYRNNNIPCIIAAPGQTLQLIASALKVKPSTLLAYNELDNEPAGITPGSIVYIAPKTSSVRNGYKTHYVVKGETLHYVAQKYGIHVAKLAKVNGMDLNYQIKPGQKLRLQ